MSRRRHRHRRLRKDYYEGDSTLGRGYRHEERQVCYRSRKGKIFGVCQGMADYFDLSVLWVRCLVICAAVFTGFWPIVAFYLVAALMMKVAPVLPLETEADEEFYQSYSTSRPMAIHRLKRTYDDLDRRIQRLETRVTARDYDWEDRLNS